MSHPFGDRIRRHLSRKHGLSQSRLAEGVDLDAAVISAMCRGLRLTGPLARERVLKIIDWFHVQNVLHNRSEADALLIAAKMAPLQVDPADALERRLTERLPEAAHAIDSVFAEASTSAIRQLASHTVDEQLLKARRLFRDARKAFSARDYVQAEDLLREIISIDQDSSSYLGLLGRALVRNAKFEEAIFYLTAALELTQVNTLMYRNNRGIAYRLLGQYGKALDDFKENINKSPKSTTALELRALTWLNLGHLENALQDIDRIVLLKPQDICGHATRSIILRALGDAQGANRELEMSEAIPAQEGGEFYCLAKAYCQHKNDEKALLYLNLAAKMEPRYRNWAPFEPLLEPMAHLPEFREIVKTKVQ